MASCKKIWYIKTEMTKKRPISITEIIDELEERGLLDFSQKIADLQEYNEMQRRFFNNVVDIFEKPLPKEVERRLASIVSLAEIKSTSTVLDVGTGTGAVIPYILKYKPKEIIACDLSLKMLEKLKEKYPEVKTYQADVKDLPLPDASIDIAFFNAVWPNIGDKPSALKNLYRMFRKGGKIVISHPEGRLFVSKLKDSVPFPLNHLPDFYEIDAFLKNFSFVIKKYIDKEKLYFVLAEKE